MAVLIKALTLVAVLLVPGLFLNGIFAGQASLEAGVEAMNRGHYATALRAFRTSQRREMLRQKTILVTCTKEGLGRARLQSALKWYSSQLINLYRKVSIIRVVVPLRVWSC